MDGAYRLTDEFEQRRPRLRAVAYRMLGSLAEADDAVQDTWERVAGADISVVQNLDAWLTTVVARVCLNVLRSRERRGELPLDVHVPDPILDPDGRTDPEHAAVLSDSIGIALMVVLETLTPPERVAFVLHDLFAVPFDAIAELVERTPAATRQLASRARRRLAEQAPRPDADPRRQREVVDAFFAASRSGDLDALVSVLDVDIVLRADGGRARPRQTFVVRGAEGVAQQALASARLPSALQPVLVNGAAAVIVVVRGRPMFLMAFTVSGGLVRAIDVLADPDRLARLEVSGAPFGGRRPSG